MTDRPIIFSAPMVRALLAGRKSQTRRVLKPQPSEDIGLWLAERRLPYAISDRLWVREAFARVGDNPDDIHACPDLMRHAYYRCDATQPELLRWRPSIHMPRWASRLTLTVTDVRVERLQEISDGDAIDEGLDFVAPSWGIKGLASSWSAYPCHAYMDLWNHLHGPGAWDANPWIVAISFDVRKGNVDDL